MKGTKRKKEGRPAGDMTEALGAGRGIPASAHRLALRMARGLLTPDKGRVPCWLPGEAEIRVALESREGAHVIAWRVTGETDAEWSRRAEDVVAHLAQILLGNALFLRLMTSGYIRHHVTMPGFFTVKSWEGGIEDAVEAVRNQGAGVAMALRTRAVSRSTNRVWDPMLGVGIALVPVRAEMKRARR